MKFQLESFKVAVTPDGRKEYVFVVDEAARLVRVYAPSPFGVVGSEGVLSSNVELRDPTKTERKEISALVYFLDRSVESSEAMYLAMKGIAE